MNISPDFSPPVRLLQPYFKLGALFYLLSMLSLPLLDVRMALNDFTLVGWSHLYMLGFVMMTRVRRIRQLDADALRNPGDPG